jgi:hypothetical protein
MLLDSLPVGQPIWEHTRQGQSQPSWNAKPTTESLTLKINFQSNGSKTEDVPLLNMHSSII